MNGIVASRPNYNFELDHCELLGKVTQTISMMDPVRNSLGCLIPWMGTWLSNHVELRAEDRLQTPLMSPAAKRAALQKVNDLKNAAGIEMPISLYTSLEYYCSSFGGTLSLASPIVSVPRPLLTEPSDSIYPQQDHPDPLDDPPEHWTFTRAEVTFFIAREIAAIKANDALLRLATKVLFVSLVFFSSGLDASLLIRGSLIVSAAVLHLLSEQRIHGKLDLEAIDILTNYFGDHDLAVAAASTTLQKLALQNKERYERKSGWLTFYLTSSGNNLLDLDHPFLSTRLDAIISHRP